MFTSNYNSFNINNISVSISGDRGKKASYNGKCYSSLAPKKEFWEEYHNNIGVISEEENNMFYIEKYYEEVLSKLDPDKVYDDLKDKVLLCYEKDTEFCHRFIVAAWIKLLFNEDVYEIKNKGKKIEIIKHDNSDIEKKLETVMKKHNRNNYGFSSLQALRLYKKSLKYRDEADRLEAAIPNYDVASYYYAAIDIKNEALEIEETYRENNQNKQLIKAS